MRFFLVVLLSFSLLSCGGSRRTDNPQPPRTKATAKVAVAKTHVRFNDSDRFDWTGRRPWSYAVHGIDVSKFQGDIDWQTLPRSGINFAYIKATEGADHADDKFRENWRAAKRSGVLRGAYHFYYFCRTGAQQARWFIQNVPRDAGALPPALDMEWNHKSRTCRHRPSPAKVRQEMHSYLSIVTAHYGKRPIIYVTPDFYHENKLWRIHGYAFWLRSVADHPSAKYRGANWQFWQYTGTGRVDGIASNVDINTYSGTVSDWQDWVAANTR